MAAEKETHFPRGSALLSRLPWELLIWTTQEWSGASIQLAPVLIYFCFLVGGRRVLFWEVCVYDSWFRDRVSELCPVFVVFPTGLSLVAR